MNRHHGVGYHEPISAAFDCLAARLSFRLTGVGFVTGVAPHKIGLENRNGAYPEYGYHWFIDYGDVASTWVGKRHGLPDDQVTVFLPYRDPEPWVVLHELGHALHSQLAFVDFGEAVTDYGRSNPTEAFADIFAMWAWNGRGFAEQLSRAPRSVALLAQLGGA